MPRYIDADAMIRKICGMKCGCERYECGYDEAGCPKVRDLETAPTVSPDEVRGVGKWITKENGKVWWYECSCCGTRPLKSRWADEETLSCYCPSCGARMEVNE